MITELTSTLALAPAADVATQSLGSELHALVRPYLLTAIEGILLVLVPLLGHKLNEWAKAKVHDARFHCAMDKLEKHAEKAVLDVGQTYVKGVRRDGKWGGEAATLAKEKARGQLLTLLGPGGRKELLECLGQDEKGLSGLIDSAIETALVKAKAWLPASQHPVEQEPKAPPAS